MMIGSLMMVLRVGATSSCLMVRMIALPVVPVVRVTSGLVPTVGLPVLVTRAEAGCSCACCWVSAAIIMTCMSMRVAVVPCGHGSISV